MKTKIITSQNGPDDQDYEEVLLADEEKYVSKLLTEEDLDALIAAGEIIF